jgi:hypothetical protein
MRRGIHSLTAAREIRPASRSRTPGPGNRVTAAASEPTAGDRSTYRHNKRHGAPHDAAFYRPATTATLPPPPPTTSQPAPPPTQSVQATTAPTAPAAPPPASAANLCGASANPDGDNFCHRGGLIIQPAADTCSYFGCIGKFNNGKGYMVECQDGMYSMSGGRSGACSSHEGELRPVYAGP